MLQTIRDKITGWFAAVFLGAIAVVFVFWGIEVGSIGTSISSYAAKVNGDRIPLTTVQRAWQERQSQLQQMMKAELPDTLKKQQQTALMDEIIRQRLVAQRVEKLGFRASDASIVETLYGLSALQVDGKFSRERYKAALIQQGLSEAQFEEQLRGDLEVNQLQNGVIGTAFVTPRELARQQALEGEQREIDYVVLPAKNYENNVSVKDEQAQAYFDAHKGDYMTAETVDLQYVELKLEDTAKEVQVTDEALRNYYEQIKSRYETTERRRARHILITTGDGVDDTAAQKQAEDVMAKLKAGGDFAALAKQYSKDPGSAANGGDLGWATRGTFVGPFEEALFSMSVGELRGPVKTQFGYHVIKLDELEAARNKSFEEVRAEVEKEYRNEQAQSQFYDKTQKLADESFTKLTELDSVAKAFNAPLQTIAGFTRQGGGEFANQSQVIEAAFSPSVLDKGENSPLITLGEDRALVLRVSNHKEPMQKPLDEVRAEVVAKVKDQEARAAAAKQGQAALTRLQSGALNWAAVAKEVQATSAGKKLLGRQAEGVSPLILRTGFAVAKNEVAENKPAYRSVTLENGDYAVVAVTAVRSGAESTDAKQAEAKRSEVSNQVGSAEFGNYLSELQRKAKIERNPAAFE